jgi:general secretion pathway protein K
VRQRGVALLAASVAIAIVTVFTTEFTTNTNVDWAAATNARDDMRAHFLARSGMNLAELIIKVQTDVLDKNRNLLGDIQLADFMPMFMGAFGGEKEEVQAFADLLGRSADDLKGLGVEIGGFEVEIGTDDDKINLNCARGSDQIKRSLQTKLEALVYFDIYNPVFENPDAEGYRRDRAQQVAAMIDYIDLDSRRADSEGASEDYGYQTLKDRYKAKNNYIDTVDEIKLARGVDDRFWTLFGDRFTVYGDCKENLSALDNVMQIASLIFITAKDQNDPVLSDMRKLFALAQRVAEARQWGMPFDSQQSFIDFVKDPNAAFGELLSASGLSETAGAQLPTNQIPVEGVELDRNKLNQVTRTGPRRTYRVTTRAHIDTLEKTIVGVWDKDTTNQNPRGPEYTRGAWVFWREE